MYYLDFLQLRGFRNFSDQRLRFNQNFNIISGSNGQGKTNLLEAIYYLSVSRSFRTNQDLELIHFGHDFFYLNGLFVKSYLSHRVQVSYAKAQKLQVKIDNNAQERFSYLQKFPVVVFSPDDLRIIQDGPAIRRRFINLEGSRLNPLFFEALKKYQRVLLQRNNLLKQNRGRSSLEDCLKPWDSALTQYGSKIILERLKLLKTLEEEANPFFKRLSSASEELRLEYKSSFKFNAAEDDYDKIRQSFSEALLAKRELEFKRGSTMTGPHLDDFRILASGVDARHYSSQGQKRTAALALKMAEVKIFAKNNLEEPIILLDDVFSEFDDARKSQLLAFLSDQRSQCFITTASKVDELTVNLTKDFDIFKVSQGRVFRETDL